MPAAHTCPHTRHWLARLACVAALGACPTLAQVRTEATAPDGHRGLGQETPLQELLSLVRSSRDDDREFFAALHLLGTEVRILVATVTEQYRQRGFFALLDSTRDPSLTALHEAVLALDADPCSRLALGDAAAQALARMLLDPRVRARISVLEGWEFEVQELGRGLAVLRAATDGYVVLEAAEASNIAARVDLSASVLRAMRNDLNALRPGAPDPDAERTSEAAAVELLRIASAAEGEGVRRTAVDRVVGDARALAARMSSALFTPRLTQQLAVTFEWRRRIFQESQPLREQALVWLPDSDEGRAAPDDIARQQRDERMRNAAGIARKALAIDPLDEIAAWVSAHAVDFQWGLSESRPLYDRFLALRGIRAHDHRTYQRRELDLREREALDAVQRSVLPGPPRGARF